VPVFGSFSLLINENGLVKKTIMRFKLDGQNALPHC
jgi:hypothetical protein